MLRILAGLLVAFWAWSIAPSARAQTVVASVDGRDVSLDEFESRYLKTVGDEALARDGSIEEYEEFLERYVDFLIKVLAANEAGYDRDPEVQGEIHLYRARFARPYLTDREVVVPILQQMYDRMQYSVHASHIMVRFGVQNPTPGDTLRHWQSILALRDSVLEGEHFGDVAYRHSQDPTARREDAQSGYRGDLGYFTAGQMVKEFEDVAYSLPIGEVSHPFRTRFGYHLIQVHDREPRPPAVRVAHIMVSFRGQTAADTSTAVARMDSLHALIQGGADFAQVALDESDDRASATSGGELGPIEFEPRGLDLAFHRAAFALEHVGDVSDVVESGFGFHLIRLLGRDSLGTFEQEYATLERMASGLPRMTAAEEALATQSRAMFASSMDSTLIGRVLGGIPRDSVRQYLQEVVRDDSLLAQMPVATLEDSTYRFSQIAAFAAAPENRVWPQPTPRMQGFAIVSAFLDHAAITRRALDMEASDPEFREIMREFRDGLKLFELMEDSVWAAAAEDSVRQMQYYAARAGAYAYPDRHRILELASPSDSALARVKELLDAGATWEALMDSSANGGYPDIRMDSVLVALPSNSVYDRVAEVPVGQHTDLIASRNLHVVLIHDGIEGARAKTFAEARAEVINGLQEELESEMTARLRKRYRVDTYPDRLSEAFARTEN